MCEQITKSPKFGFKIGLGSLIILAGLSTSSSASNPLDFQDEAIARGVDFEIGFNFAQFGAGLMMVDLDGDLDLDLVIAGGVNQEIGIFENNGKGQFTDRSAASGLTNQSVSSGMSVADYDNDGDDDFFIAGWLSPSRMYRNDGNFTFTDVTASAGLMTNCPLMASSWADIDGDGDLDMYASVRTLTNADPTRNFMFQNNGDGTFTNVAGSLGIDAEENPTLLCSFFDYDQDGDDDLYLGTDKGGTPGINNRLYRNDLGSFTEVTDETNTAANVECMGIAVGDMNNDGIFDLYLTNIFAGNKLLMSNGKGAFVDQTAAAGLGNFRIGWGTVFADFDNDSLLDVYVCNMGGDNRLYRGTENWPMIDEAPSAGVDEESNVFCVAVGDVDGDNDLDMLVGDSGGNVHLYINHSKDVQLNNWVRFNIVGHIGSNQVGLGTTVSISANGKDQVREVRSGVNYKAQDEYTLHFGLGSAKKISKAGVTYSADKTRSLSNVPMNETWTIYPSSRRGDVNGDGCVGLEEYTMAVKAITLPGQHIVPGQEIFDVNGDFVIDIEDIQVLGLGICAGHEHHADIAPQ